MAKVLPFSQKFPSYHPKAGQSTYFVEKVLNSLDIDYHEEGYLVGLYRMNKHNPKLSIEEIKRFFYSLGALDEGDSIGYKEKLHTIRAGHRWKQGELASPRVWSGVPYHSPQIIFAPDTKVVQTYDVELMKECYGYDLGIPIKEETWSLLSIGEVAKNDGLTYDEFINWFVPKPDKFKGFDGQIIAWKDPQY